MTDHGTAFNAWCLFLEPTEGGLSLDPGDTGNYTPTGELKGSKFGISAHSYPDLDIANLTIEVANDLRYRDYWGKVRGDELPGPVAFVLAEGAYGSGPVPAIKQMQRIIGTKDDGVFGTLTLDALNKRLAAKDGIEDFVVEYQAQRLLFEASLGEKWEHNQVGWSRRLFHATARALFLAGAPVTVAVPTIALAPELLMAEGTYTITVKRAAP